MTEPKVKMIWWNGADTSADGAWAIQTEHIREEGTWCYPLWMPDGAEEYAERHNIETNFCGRGAKQKVKAAMGKIAAGMAQETLA